MTPGNYFIILPAAAAAAAAVAAAAAAAVATTSAAAAAAAAMAAYGCCTPRWSWHEMTLTTNLGWKISVKHFDHQQNNQLNG